MQCSRIADQIVPRPGTAGESQPRDGLCHLFEAREGCAIPSTLANISLAFFVFEIPLNFMGPVNLASAILSAVITFSLTLVRGYTFYGKRAFRQPAFNPLLLSSARRGKLGILVGEPSDVRTVTDMLRTALADHQALQRLWAQFISVVALNSIFNSLSP